MIKRKEKTYYKFSPQVDIESYELAIIISSFSFWGDNMRYEISKKKQELLGPMIMRHFKVSEVNDNTHRG